MTHVRDIMIHVRSTPGDVQVVNISQNATFLIFLQLETSQLDVICTDYDHILPFVSHKSTLVRFCFIYKA